MSIPDVAALSAMVQHAEKLGGQVAGAFREFSDGIRRSRRQQAEEQGNKASIKLLFPIVFFLAPPIYVLLLGPAMIELKNFVQEGNKPGGALSQTPQPGNLRSQQLQEPTPATDSASAPSDLGNDLPSVLRPRPTRPSGSDSDSPRQARRPQSAIPRP